MTDNDFERSMWTGLVIFFTVLAVLTVLFGPLLLAVLFVAAELVCTVMHSRATRRRTSECSRCVGVGYAADKGIFRLCPDCGGTGLR